MEILDADVGDDGDDDASLQMLSFVEDDELLWRVSDLAKDCLLGFDVG